MKPRATTEHGAVERRPIPHSSADPQFGLTAAQAQQAAASGWANTPVDPPVKSTKQIIKSNLFTYFNLVFAVLAVLLVCVGSFRSLTFLPVVLANLFIGILQEVRARNVLDRLTVLTAPKATVLRDGASQEIPTEGIVLGDILLFRAGNQIPADAVVADGEVTVNESLLTGEADEIVKKPGDLLLSGSYVVSGTCRARADKVGADAYISRLTQAAKTVEQEEESEMLRVLDKLVGMVGILIVPIGGLLFVQQFVLNGMPLQESVTSMVAAVIGMIPEGLYLLTSVALVVSVTRLAKQRVLVHDKKCMETLARVDVLCVDKTGTITETDMRVNTLITMPDFRADAMPPLKTLIGDFAAAMPGDNITMEAVKRGFPAASDRKAGAVVPFSPVYKYSAAAFDDGAYVLGAPEFVLGGDYPFYKASIERYASNGDRVLLFGRCDGVPDGKALAKPVTPLGLILMSNPIRKDAPDTFRYFAEQGVEIKVISGDHPATVSRVAKNAGIRNAEMYIDASVLTTPEALSSAAERYTVFGRVTPQQKKALVEALQRAGHTVGMTGDGVNDILALKAADCSVAMASGSDAAAQVSQLVLLESDFARMPAVVDEGRRVVNNIQRSASLFLVKNIFSFFLAILSLCFHTGYPLEPSQVSLISMFTIGIPGFFLALQPNRERIQGRFLPNVLVRALPAGLTDFLVVGALVLFGREFSIAPQDLSIACTMLLAIVGFMILYRISKPMNLWRWCLWVGCVVGLLACSVCLGDLFAMGQMTTKCVMLFLVFAVATEPVLRYLTRLTEHLSAALDGAGRKRMPGGKP